MGFAWHWLPWRVPLNIRIRTANRNILNLEISELNNRSSIHTGGHAGAKIAAPSFTVQILDRSISNNLTMVHGWV
ncbi:hypothetical protein BFN67_13775 [Pseudaminobacter manganicus]|uniref:Uncharacterized protein n=1 Tax=Manganibacter manganicus TaxID=1873176 RepID=A0A1V8RTB8_9HYPH|nr:hypothetical protein BFN67_13775 [Pseudaminobacter manganicus]